MARLDRIEDLLLKGEEVYAEIERDFPGPTGEPLCRRVIDRDIAEAWARIRKRYEAARVADAPKIRTWWERLATKAEHAGDMKAAVAALDRLTKLLGLYAPTRAKLEVTGGVAVNVNVQVRGIVGVLSERGLEAMRVLHEEIEAARVAGKLPAAAPKAEPDDDEDDEDPVPVPSSGSVN